MKHEPEMLAARSTEALAAVEAVSDVSPAVTPVVPTRRASGFRFERRSSYCAETAWVWQRARFVCAKQP